MILILITLLSSNLQYEGGKMEIVKEEDFRVIHLMEGVHLFDSKIDITGKEAWFAQARNSLVVKDSLVIEAPDGVRIVGDSLYFDTRERTSYIYRRVIVTRDRTRITGPELVIDHRKREAHIPYGARIYDLEEGIVVAGDDAHYSLAQNRGSILCNPVLTDEEQGSNFRVDSERMHLDQGSKSVSAAENARILSEDATVTCDTLVLFYEKNKGHAFGNIAMSNPDGVIEADSADFSLLDRRLEKIFLYPSVQTRYHTEGSDSVRLDSPYLTIDLSEKDKEIMIFTGGAHGTYFWREEETED